MVEKLVEVQGMLSMGFTTKLMISVLLSIIYGRAKRKWIVFLANIIHFVIYNIIVLGILNDIYSQELWFRFIVATTGTGIALTIAVILSLCWKIQFFKLLTTYICLDAVSAMSVYIAGYLNPNPVFIFGFGMSILAIIIYFGTPTLKKIRHIQFLGSWILGGFLLTILVNSWLSNILYVWTDKLLVSDVMIFFGLGQMCISLIFIFLECLVYYIISKHKQSMLLRNKDQMEDYYRQVARHIREIDETRLLLEQGAKLLTGGAAGKVETTETAETAGESNLPSEELRAHLHRLTEQYEALGEVFFCSDFAVDSVLRDFVRTCRRQGIRTDILFHEYHREKVSAGDAAAILSRMLDYGIKTAEDCRKDTRISVHGATVKNQLLFSMTVSLIPKEKDPEETQMKNPEGNKAEDHKKDQTENQEKGMENEKKKEKKISDGKKTTKTAEKTLRKIPVRKRSFFPWIRKYNGIIHVQREEKRVQMDVGLENGIYD